MLKARRRSLRLPEDDKAFRKAIRLPAAKPLPVEIPPWTLHDLRRTAATGMARLNFPPHVVDKIFESIRAAPSEAWLRSTTNMRISRSGVRRSKHGDGTSKISSYLSRPMSLHFMDR